MDTLLFIVSKMVGGLIRADTWIVLLSAVIALSLVKGRIRLARQLSLVLFTALIVVAVLPIGDVAIRPLELRFPADPPLTRLDGIIVLGGAEDVGLTALRDQLQLNEGAERYTSALALARRFPKALILFAGGSGELRDLVGAKLSEADVAHRFFTGQGLAEERMLFEGRSRNTSENARLSLELVQPKGGDKWILITSAYHMPRALHSFERAGWVELVPYPVDFRSTSLAKGIGWNLAGNLQNLNTAVKEWIGLLAYRLLRR